jgi:hypothetical protein
MAYTTINKGSSYFNTVTYAGAGGTQAVTGTGFQPDFVWIKNRSITADHMLYDAVRGTGTSKPLTSDNTDAEGLGTNVGLPSQYGYLSAFGSDGFTVVQGSVGGNFVNSSGNNFVSWNWLANNTSGSSNTSGSITSTVAANTTAGFSIVSWTGTGTTGTVGHGLGVAPSFYIVKRRNADGFDWFCYHKSLGATKFILLDTTGAEQTSDLWNDTSPTSTVFNVKTQGSVNASGGTYIAYCFAEIKGYSKFGSYTGNGSTDGPFVYTGFKPAFVMFKNSTTAGTNWQINDSARDTFNVMNKRLAPSTSDAEATDYNFGDFLSNGFKIRQTDQTWNKSGDTYIYMCFASNPFVTSGGISVTAR